jgi:hypothetical protein
MHHVARIFRATNIDNDRRHERGWTADGTRQTYGGQRRQSSVGPRPPPGQEAGTGWLQLRCLASLARRSCRRFGFLRQNSGGRKVFVGNGLGAVFGASWVTARGLKFTESALVDGASAHKVLTRVSKDFGFSILDYESILDYGARWHYRRCA